jgi:hypothetical protein
MFMMWFTPNSKMKSSANTAYVLLHDQPLRS